MGTAWEFARLQQPEEPVLRKLGKEDWDDHLDFILGEDIAQQKVDAADGSMVYKTPWLSILEIEYQIRK